MNILDIYLLSPKHKIIASTRSRSFFSFNNQDENKSALESVSFRRLVKLNKPLKTRHRIYYGLKDDFNDNLFVLVTDADLLFSDVILNKLKSEAANCKNSELTQLFHKVKNNPETFYKNLSKDEVDTVKAKTIQIRKETVDAPFFQQKLSNFVEQEIEHQKQYKDEISINKVLQLNDIKQDLVDNPHASYDFLKNELEKCRNIVSKHRNTGFSGVLRLNFYRKTRAQTDLDLIFPMEGNSNSNTTNQIIRLPNKNG